MSLFGNDCGGGDQWIWIIIVFAVPKSIAISFVRENSLIIVFINV